MATTADLDTAVAAKLDAIAELGTRLAVDQSTALARPAKGATNYQLLCSPLAKNPHDLNDLYIQTEVVVAIIHHLTDVRDDRTYTTGDLVTISEQILATDWWEALSEVFQLMSGPAGSRVTRQGPIITYAIEAVVDLVP